MITIKDIMNPNVKTVSKDQTVFQAAKSMCENEISCLIVAEENSVVGIITRRDLLDKVLIQKVDPEKITVEEIMTSPVRTIPDTGNLVFASGIMNSRKIKQLPIVTDDKLVGIITMTDIVLNINSITGFDRKNTSE